MTIAELITWCIKKNIDIRTCKITPMGADVKYIGYNSTLNAVTLEEESSYEDDYNIWEEIE